MARCKRRLASLPPILTRPRARPNVIFQQAHYHRLRRWADLGVSWWDPKLSASPRIVVSSQRTSATGFIGQNKRLWTLFGVHGGRKTLGLIQICSADYLPHNGFFKTLQETYRDLRGFWRAWFSFWKFSHCDFVKISMYLAILSKLLFPPRSWPFQVEKNWNKSNRLSIYVPIYQATLTTTTAPQPPQAEIPPITPHEFELANLIPVAENLRLLFSTTVLNLKTRKTLS